MKTHRFTVLLCAATSIVVGAATALAQFTPLSPVPAPRIINSAEAFPGGGFPVAHLLDGLPNTEYSSNGKGTNTFVAT